jgi:hypothetical protein
LSKCHSTKKFGINNDEPEVMKNATNNYSRHFVVGIAIINPVANAIKLFFLSPSMTLKNNELERLPQQSVSEWSTS